MTTNNESSDKREQLIELLHRCAVSGLSARFDMNPTMNYGQDAMALGGDFQRYMGRMSDFVKELAADVLPLLSAERCMDENMPVLGAGALSVIGSLFGLRFTEGCSNGCVELYVEDDDNWHYKMRFDRAWLIDLKHVAEKALLSNERACTCHPDDNPPVPCPRKYALAECREAARSSELPRDLAKENATENSEAIKLAEEIIAGDRIKINVREVMLARALLRAEDAIILQRELLNAPRSASAPSKDEERYRWLRSSRWYVQVMSDLMDRYPKFCVIGTELDAAVDAAMDSRSESK